MRAAELRAICPDSAAGRALCTSRVAVGAGRSRCDSPFALCMVLPAPPKRSRDGCVQSSCTQSYTGLALCAARCTGAGEGRALRGEGGGLSTGRQHRTKAALRARRARTRASPASSPSLLLPTGWQQPLHDSGDDGVGV